MTSAATIARVNESATGVWAARVGQELVVIGPGANQGHVIVRRPQDRERSSFGFPSSWLDMPRERPLRPRRLRVMKGVLG